MDKSNILRYFPALAIGVSAILAGIILYLILRYGVDIQLNDQWEYVGFFDHLSIGRLTFEELFRQHNEYRKLFPNLILVCLGWFTNWNVRYEMIVIFILACLVSLNILKLTIAQEVDYPWQKWVAFILANLFIFSPIQWENWIFGIQIEYFMPIACLTTGFVLANTRMEGSGKFIICIVLSVISTFSSINGFLIWLILYPVFFFSGRNNEFFRKWLPIVVWVLFTVGNLFFYFHGYSKPGTHPSLSLVFEHPVDAMFYFLGTIGNNLRIIHLLNPIVIVGGFVIIVFAAAVLYVILHFKDKQLVRDSIVWVMLGLYSVGTAVMLTVGRLGFGVYQSLASRYTTFTLYIGVAVVFLVLVVGNHIIKGRKGHYFFKSFMIFIAAFIVFSKVSTFAVAVNELKIYHAYIRHAKAGLLFINYIPLEECSNKIYPTNTDELRRIANILDKLGYIRPGLVKSFNLADIEASESRKLDFGTFDKVVLSNDTTGAAFGFCKKTGSNETVDAVLLSLDNVDGNPFLLTLYNADSLNWKKTFYIPQTAPDTIRIKAWAFDATTGKAFLLKGEHIIYK